MGLGINLNQIKTPARRVDADLSPSKWLLILIVAFVAAMMFDNLVNGREFTPVEQLGRNLFHDKRLSQNVSTACASCHSSDHAGTDGRARAVGRIGEPNSPNGRVGPRKTPTVWNAVLVEYLDRPEQFLDHRAKDPIDQAIMPISNPDEMGNLTAQQTADRLNRIAGYRALCQQVFGDPTITPQRMRVAMVAYERTFKAIDTPLKRYLDGDKEALSDAEARGAEIINRSQCLECHRPPTFTTGRCANNGYSFVSGGDIGLLKTTGNPAHRRAIKIPSWVGVGIRSPYMHNGQFADLTLVVRHYNAGATYPGQGRDPLADHRVKKLNLSNDQIADVVQCLKTGTIPYDLPDMSPPQEPLR